MARKKKIGIVKTVDIKFVYLLILVIVILSAMVGYVTFITYTTSVKSGEAPVVITSTEKAVEVQQNLTTTISDIKGDLEQLKKSLGK